MCVAKSEKNVNQQGREPGPDPGFSVGGRGPILGGGLASNVGTFQ